LQTLPPFIFSVFARKDNMPHVSTVFTLGNRKQSGNVHVISMYFISHATGCLKMHSGDFCLCILMVISAFQYTAVSAVN
jgi:hypothetical protein